MLMLGHEGVCTFWSITRF